MEEQKKPKSLLDKIKQKSQNQKTYGGQYNEKPANLSIRACPNCGAGRANQDGLTHCAYCGFEFLSVKLTDGINIKSNDNSQTF